MKVAPLNYEKVCLFLVWAEVFLWVAQNGMMCLSEKPRRETTGEGLLVN